MGWFHPIVFFTSAFTQFTTSYSALSRPKGRTRLLLEILRSTFRTSVHLTTVLHRRAQLKIRNHFFEFDWTLSSSSFGGFSIEEFGVLDCGGGVQRSDDHKLCVCGRQVLFFRPKTHGKVSLAIQTRTLTHAAVLFSLFFFLSFFSPFSPLLFYFSFSFFQKQLNGETVILLFVWPLLLVFFPLGSVGFVRSLWCADSRQKLGSSHRPTSEFV